MTNYIILLPPSEGKKKRGDESMPLRLVKNFKQYNYFKNLWIEREEIYGKLREAITKSSFKDLEKIFDLKGKNLQDVIEITSDLLNQETMPAIQRYNGVMFNAIDYINMNENKKKNFEESVIFIDGMFGLLKPLDLIPEYKLKITSKFLDINITKFWQEKLKSILSGEFKEKLVVDILPESHKKVITKNEDYNIISIKFCEVKENKLINVGHDSKKLKGEIVNYLVEKENITREYIKEFKHTMGYKFSEKYSNYKELIFLKL